MSARWPRGDIRLSRPARTNIDRAQYISQLADGAFAYFSLEVDPQAADDFSSRLDALNIFVDTNFLFGVLGLNSGPAVQVAAELVSLIERSQLPFKVYYLPRTSKELRSTITYYGQGLRGTLWPQQLSRSIVDSRTTSGIVTRYHELNSNQPLRPDDFLRPFSEVDNILKSKHIALYPASQIVEEPDKLRTIIDEYTEFLASRNRTKLTSVIEHDMSILSSVGRMQELRPKTQIGQRAIFLTFDYNLYRFDDARAKRLGIDPVVVLPNIFMQVIRPLVNHRPDFDKAFAETFALPEFRTVGAGSNEAILRLTSILASYKQIGGELAAKILTNISIRDRLQSSVSDDEIRAEIELAIVADNRSLQERMRELEMESAETRSEKQATLVAMDQLRQAKDEVLEERAMRILELEGHVQLLSRSQEERDEAEAELRRRLEQAERALAEITSPIQNPPQSMPVDETDNEPFVSWKACLVGLLAACLALVSVHWARWEWLLNHEQRIGLQGLGALFIVMGCISALDDRRRIEKTTVSVILAILIALLSIA